MAGFAEEHRVEKHGGHGELDTIGGEEQHLHGGHEQQSQKDGRKGHCSVAVNTRPKALEDAATLSMVVVVADQATTNSTDATKGEEQASSNMSKSACLPMGVQRFGPLSLSFSFSLFYRASCMITCLK